MFTIRLFHAAFEPNAVHVADYDCDNMNMVELERVFSATQNVDSNWVKQNGQFGIRVRPTAEVQNKGGCRSTSVGDYVTVLENGKQIALYSCDMVGWTNRSKE